MHPDLESYLVDFDTAERKENFRLRWFWYDWIKQDITFARYMDYTFLLDHAILCSE